MSINWNNLQIHEGSKQRAFEALSCQLFHQEFYGQGEYRRISAPDKGIECCLIKQNGNILGLQSKYFTKNFDKIQVQKSLLTALIGYPKLIEWRLSLHIDRSEPDPTASEWKNKWDNLRDSLKERINNGIPDSWKSKTFRGEVKKQKQRILSKLDSVRLSLWTTSGIEEFLSKPENVGKRLFWFGELEFDFSALERTLKSKISQIEGSKYIRDLHVSGDLNREIHVMLGSQEAIDEYDEIVKNLKQQLGNQPSVSQRLKHSKIHEKHLAYVKQIETKLSELENSFRSFFAKIERFCQAIENGLLWEAQALNLGLEKIQDKIEAVGKEIRKAIYDCPEDLKKEDGSWGPEYVKFANQMEVLEEWFGGIINGVFTLKSKWDVFRAQKLIVLSEPGIGKTHAVCKASEKQIEAGRLAVLLFGSHFQGPDPLREQITKQFGISLQYGWHDIVAALETAAETYGSRLLFVIDALNESPVWDSVFTTQILELMAELTHSPWIGVVVTSRESYSEPIFGKRSPENSIWIRPESDIDEYRKTYLNHYKLDFTYLPPSVERLLDHRFYVTLIAKTYGNFMSKEVQRISLPDIDLSDIFEKYIQLHDTEICKRLDAPTGCSILRDKLLTLAGQLWRDKQINLPKKKAIKIIEGKEPAQVKMKDSWTYAFMDEGFLVDFTWLNKQEVIEFSHQRLGDYLIAIHLVEGKNESEITNILKTQSDHPHLRDILQMIALVLPAKLGKHLFEITPTSDTLDEAQIWAFFEMKPSFISQGSKDWLKAKFEGFSPEKRRQVFYHFFHSADYPGYPLNVSYLNNILKKLPMAERDLSWTEWIRSEAEVLMSHLETFENIFIQGGNESSNETLHLWASFFSWLLSSTHRPLRDRATKALYWYGRCFSNEFFDLTIQSLSINDPYIPERMLAASYGIAMALHRDMQAEKFREKILPDFAKNLFEMIFKVNAPYSTTHILARDYARRTIEVAQVHKKHLLNGTEKKRITPPFRSMGIQKWLVNREKGEDDYKAGSMPIHMDFGNYTLGRLIPGRRNYDFDNKGYKKVRGNLFWRIYSLGYSHEAFKEIDKDIARSRYTRAPDPAQIDRYGKKYSWIAFYEIAGYRHDKGLLGEREEIRPYYDLDPSFPELPGQMQIVKTDFLAGDPRSLVKWIERGPLPDMHPYMVIDEIKDNKGPWVLLDGFENQTNYKAKRGIFIFTRGFYLKKAELHKFMELKDKVSAAGRSLPESEEDYYTFAGEIPWCDTFPYNEYPASIEIHTGNKEIRKGGYTKKDLKRGYTEREVEKNNEFPVEIPVRQFSWESLHSTVNPGQSVNVPSKEISQKLSFYIEPQSFDMLDSNGKRASMCLLWGEWPNIQKLIYLRKDLLEKYLRCVRKELVWIVWGEREYMAKDNKGLFKFRDKHISYKVFQDIFSYSQVLERKSLPTVNTISE